VCAFQQWKDQNQFSLIEILRNEKFNGHKHCQVHNSIRCIGLNESDSKLYIDFEVCEGKSHKQLKNILIYKAKQFMLTKQFWKKDGASRVQVDILNMCLSIICLKHDKITLIDVFSRNCCNNALMLIMNLRNIFTFKFEQYFQW
jgi:hypothetical protein